MYGLKQALGAWLEKLKIFIINFLQFRGSIPDGCLFIKHTDGCYVFLLVYVDDNRVTGNSSSIISDVFHSINKEFKQNDLGSLNDFLDMEVTDSDNYLLLTQRKYVQAFIEKLRH